MRILIVRHAIAEEREDWSKISADDEQRPLTKKGIKQFVHFSKVIRDIFPNPDLFLSSPLVRATQTSEILEKRYKKKYRTIKELKPEASVPRLFKFLTLSKKQDIIIVGHEPFLSTFISLCLSDNPDIGLVLKKGGCCLLETDKLQSGRCKILLLLQPKYF